MLNFLQNKSIVSHPKRMAIIKACIVRTLFHLKIKWDNDCWPTPIRGITPKSWPIVSNGQMALRKVPSKHLFLSEMNSKSFILFKLVISKALFKLQFFDGKRMDAHDDCLKMNKMQLIYLEVFCGFGLLFLDFMLQINWKWILNQQKPVYL